MSALLTHPVALHAERTDDPATVRWVTTRLAVACLHKAGDETVLAALRTEGVVVAVTLDADRVEVTAADGKDWRELGTRVREALADELAAAVQEHGADDSVLLDVASAVLEEQVGALARTHGGSLAVLDVTEGVVTVGRSGACGHCPAASATVNRTFEEALRDQAPGVRTVRSVDDGSTGRGRRTLLGLPTLRRG